MWCARVCLAIVSQHCLTLNTVSFHDASCPLNQACSMDHCQSSLPEGLHTDAIYTDFPSAFTSVNHRLLLYKLCHSFNITGPVLDRV